MIFLPSPEVEGLEKLERKGKNHVRIASQSYQGQETSPIILS